MKIEQLLMITLMAVVGFFDWLIYKDCRKPAGFRDEGLGWGTHRRWMENTYGLRRAYRPGCITIIFGILILIGYLVGRAVYS